MKWYLFSSLFISAILLTGCATNSQLRKVSQEEAFSFIKSLESKNTTLPQEEKPLYIQPVNKLEPCKLPTSQDQLDRNNFQAYWDGQCKDGFAYGLGRDIAVSDTHHVEEITVYGDNGETIDSPAVTYDFVHNTVVYRSVGNEPSESTFFTEEISNEPGSFNVNYQLGEIFENGDVNVILWSPFSFRVALVNASGNVLYRFTLDKTPNNYNNPTLLFETLNKNSVTPGGFAAAKYANGQVRHFKLGEGQQELVELPQEYINMIDMKYRELGNVETKASASIEKAKKMETEYLYLACNGKHKIVGLEKDVYNKICTWREQFQNQFKTAQQQYNEILEKMKNEARSQEEQRKIQEGLDYQKRMVQAAERQARAAEDANFQNSLNQYKPTTCYTNFGITTCY